MTQQLFTQFFEQFGNLTAPAKRANALFVSHIEKLAQFQLQAAQRYTDIGIEQLRAALSINDLQSLQSFLANQSKLAQDLSQKMASDTKAITELNQQLVAESQKLQQESAQALMVKVQGNARKAA